MTGPPLRGPKPAGVAGLISITVTPEHKGLLKDTVDFSQYKSDSTSRLGVLRQETSTCARGLEFPLGYVRGEDQFFGPVHPGMRAKTLL